MKKALALVACLLVACAVFAEGFGLMGGVSGLTLNYKQDNSNITYKVASNFLDLVVGLDMDVAEYPLFTIADLPVKLYWGVGGDVGIGNFYTLSIMADAGAYVGLRIRFLEHWEVFLPQIGLKPMLMVNLGTLDTHPIDFDPFNFVGEAGFRFWF